MDRLAALRKLQRNVSDKDDHEPCEVFPPVGDSSGGSGANGLRGPLVTPEMLSRSAKRGSWATDPSDPNRAWLYQTCTEFGFYQASLYFSCVYKIDMRWGHCIARHWCVLYLCLCTMLCALKDRAVRYVLGVRVSGFFVFVAVVSTSTAQCCAYC